MLKQIDPNSLVHHSKNRIVVNGDETPRIAPNRCQRMLPKGVEGGNSVSNFGPKKNEFSNSQNEFWLK